MHPAPSPAPIAVSGLPILSTCASCHIALVGAICHACGEKRLNRHDYRLAHFLEHTVDVLTHFGLRVVRDVGTQLRRPGWLAAEWLQGRRVGQRARIVLGGEVIDGAGALQPWQTPLLKRHPLSRG